LEFFQKCFLSKDVFAYLKYRDLKYENREHVVLYIQRKKVHLLAYFPQWLSGFIERKGCFSFGKKGKSFFSIGQNHDIYLIDSIQQFLQTTNKIQLKKEQFYYVHVYRHDVFLFFETHFKNFPLLGEKKVSFETFMKKLNLGAQIKVSCCHMAVENST
jgi:hypothetical protein